LRLGDCAAGLGGNRLSRWIKVDATIVECFRAWEESPGAAHPWFEIVADIKTSTGTVERVTSRQKLSTVTHHRRSPDPGDFVTAKWDSAHRELRLDLRHDPRYDEKVIKAMGRKLHAPPPRPPGPGGGTA
jgi:hypothetical protein